MISSGAIRGFDIGLFIVRVIIDTYIHRYIYTSIHRYICVCIYIGCLGDSKFPFNIAVCKISESPVWGWETIFQILAYIGLYWLAYIYIYIYIYIHICVSWGFRSTSHTSGQTKRICFQISAYFGKARHLQLHRSTSVSLSCSTSRHAIA